MDDLRERYYRINLEFPALAGRLAQIIAFQKREVEQMSKGKSSTRGKAFLQSVADSITVGEELLTWTKDILIHVAEDAEALKEGSKIRNERKWAQEENARLMEMIK